MIHPAVNALLPTDAALRPERLSALPRPLRIQERRYFRWFCSCYLRLRGDFLLSGHH
jgi:hypothetical protein